MNVEEKKSQGRVKIRKLLSSGKSTKAAAVYKEILALDRNDADLWCELASLQNLQQKASAASSSYMQAAEIYFRLNCLKHSFAACKKAMEMDSSSMAPRKLMRTLKRELENARNPEMTPLPPPAPGLKDWNEETDAEMDMQEDRDPRAWEDRSSVIIEMVPLPEPDFESSPVLKSPLGSRKR